MFSLRSTCSPLLNKSSQTRPAAEEEGNMHAKRSNSQSQMQIKEKAAVVGPQPSSSGVNAKCVFRDTAKYHQLTICFLPLLNELFCYRVC